MAVSRKFTNWDELPIVFDLPMASILTGQSCENLKRLCQRGQLPAFKIGKEWRFEKETLRKWMAEQMKPISLAAG